MSNPLKHAYLILAHNNYYILERLIRLLDDERNDIFIHIDKKVENFDESEFQKSVSKSSLVFVKPRVDVKWGHVTFVEAEFILFRSAYEFGSYTYYHLISGVDLPIKSQDYIHKFFLENHGKEFLGISTDSLKDVAYKVTKIHVSTSFYKLQRLWLRKILFFIDRSFAFIQHIAGYNVVKLNETFSLSKGPNWVSVTHDFVELLLSKESECLKIYKHAVCPDEIFIHTVLHNSEFKNKLYNSTYEYIGCMRLIDWKRGNPYIFQQSDFDEIMSSDRIFARKFDEKDLKIVDMIFERLSVKVKQ
jgi:hypothetical protein